MLIPNEIPRVEELVWSDSGLRRGGNNGDGTASSRSELGKSIVKGLKIVCIYV